MFRSRTCLGVDSSGRDIKIVELRKVGSGYEVLQAARLSVSGGDVGIALRHFLLETETRPSSVVCSLPTNACSVKFANLPMTKPSEMLKMVRFEAEAQIPLPMSEIVWDFSAAGIDSGTSHVVIAGARRAAVEETMSVMEQVGLPLSAVTVSSLAEVRSLFSGAQPCDEPLMVIDIGDDWTDLTIVSAGRVEACRSIRPGSADLIRAIAKDYDIDTPDAEKLMWTHGPGTPVKRAESPSAAVEDWLAVLSLEIRRSALSMVAGGVGRPVSNAVLVGDNAGIPGLTDALANGTGLNAGIGDPWAGMTLSAAAAHNKRDLPAVFAVATGLAIAGLNGDKIINLVPRQRAEERIRRRRELGALSGLGVTALILAVTLIAGYPGAKAKSAVLDDLKAQVTELKEGEAGIQPGLRTITSEIERIVGDTGRKEVRPVEMLRQLSAVFPRSAWLSEFRYESGKQVVLRGSALSNSAVADSVSVVSQTGLFESVSLDYSNLAKSGESATYTFQIKCVLPQNNAGKARTGKTRLVVR